MQPKQVRSPAPAPKGHESFLKGLEQSKAEVEFEFVDGTFATGIIKASDKFTISVQVVELGGQPRTWVFFKHSIRGFSPITPAPARG